MTTQPAPDSLGALTPTQCLIMDVLAAREKLGETWWPFPSALRPGLRALAGAGLVEFKSGVTPGTCQAGLTAGGRLAILGDDRPAAAGLRVVACDYMVTAWPEDLARRNPSAAASWCVTVRRAAGDRWVVCHGVAPGIQLQPGGRWGTDVPETFTLQDALVRACEWAPRIRVAGLAAAEAIARARAGEDL